jgi:5-bromo-4-chloroindolyl phosphate hydrolysis protein
MRDSLAHINDRWGSPAAYLQAHGLTNEDIEALRSRLVEV